MPLLITQGYTVVVKMPLPGNNTMSLRHHLLQCFETGRMVIFPCSAREKGPKIRSDEKHIWHCKVCKTLV